MNNNKNNKCNQNSNLPQVKNYLLFLLYYFSLNSLKILFVSVAAPHKTEILKRELSFQVNGDIFQVLPQVCGEKNINLAILTKRQFFLTGNFYNSSLENIFKLILNDDMEIEYTNSFLIIKDKLPILKIYMITIPLEEEEKKEIDKFIKEFSMKHPQSYYIYNKAEGTVAYYGQATEHKTVKEYIKHINNYYGQQVFLECKIVTIRTSDQNRKLDIIDMISGLLSIADLSNTVMSKNENVYDSSSNIIHQNYKGRNTKRAFQMPHESLDKMRMILGYLKENYQVLNIQELHLTLRNRSVNIFQNLETKYLDKIYDSRMLPITDVENKMKATVVKNVKELKAGIKLTIRTQIENQVFLHIDYQQSSFKDRGPDRIPEIAENSFAASVQLEYDQVIALNGLTIRVKENRSQNDYGFFLLNWLFGIRNKEEHKCQVIFLIRVRKQQKQVGTM